MLDRLALEPGLVGMESPHRHEQQAALDAAMVSQLIMMVGHRGFEAAVRASLDQWHLADHFTFLMVDVNDPQPISLLTGTLGGGDLVERLTAKYVSRYFRKDKMFEEMISTTDSVGISRRSVTEAPADYRRMFFTSSGVLEKVSVACRLHDTVILASYYATQVKAAFDATDLIRLRDLSPVLCSLLLKHVNLSRETHGDASTFLRGLTSKERDVCRGILSGCSSEAIALQLGIAKSTVLTHRKAVYRKLNVVSQAQLFALLTTARHPGI